ncbi:Putative exporter of the RND superfamily [Fulvivirga imtechensis AK7]|uniref:Putative exporter of the RND superfamily n=1 Tax=Fulvivirga imtechensis AK7 TaxID=1237149 RepID=L8JKQ3_9BACT|nr:MMPL family transporter [Fulvivirga imtechensis]ELR69511.1 Putative exporter of the RND superfamily [Fulvivirga imtechensis AK7]
MNNRLQSLKSKSGKFGAGLARFVIRYRWMLILASVLSVLAAGYGAKNITFNSDYHVFFSEDNPQLLAYDALQNKYTKDDNVFVVFEPKDGNVFSPSTLSAIEEFVALGWQTSFSTRVDAITNFQYTRSEGDDLYVDDLVSNAETLTAGQLADIKSIATTDPRIKNRLVDEDGSITAVNITVKLPDHGDPKDNEKVVVYAREQIAAFQEKYPNLNIYTSGMVMLNNAFQEAAFNDMSTLTPLMFLIVLVTILLFTRTISGTFATLVVIIFSIVTAMGLGGWLGIFLTPPSSAFMNIIMTLAVADSIHILITFTQGLRNGLEKREAIIESLRVNYLPVFLTSLTTVIGFLSMNFSDSPPFRDLGNLTSLGMTAAFIFSVITLPALLAVLPVRIKARANMEKRPLTFMERLAEFVIAKKGRVAIGSVAVIVISSVFIFSNELNDEFIKYFSKDVQFRTDTDYISEHLTGIYTMEFSMGSGEPGGINNPAYLEKLQEFESWLYTHDEVIHVNSFTEVSRQVNKSMHGDNLDYYTLPDNREQAAQFLLLYEMSLPFGLDLNNQVNVDKSETRVIVTLKNISTNRMLALEQQVSDWLKGNAPSYMQSEGVSSTMMFAHLTQRQINSMITGTVLALLLISFVLAIAIKSFRFGLISLIPNLTPLIVGLGLWGLFVGYINTGISIVFGMTLGIIVDDTVHFLTKYLRARREMNMGAEDAVRYAFSTVGQALLVTTFVLVMGFLVIAQSDFGMNSGMAKITMLIISLALILDFLLLPAMLIMFANNTNEVEEADKKAELEMQAA